MSAAAAIACPYCKKPMQYSAEMAAWRCLDPYCKNFDYWMIERKPLPPRNRGK